MPQQTREELLGEIQTDFPTNNNRDITATILRGFLDNFVDSAFIPASDGPGPQGAQGAQGAQGDQGSQGNQGAQGAQGQGFTYQGNWIDSTTYQPYDVVTYDGDTWITPTVSINQIPGVAGDWYLFTSKGAQGSQGAQGPQGVQGNQGNQGFQGGQGNQGVQGTQGFQGAQGAQGSQGYQGNQGSTGTSSSLFLYQADTGATSGYPGNGHVLWNNATQVSATSINISHLTDDGTDIDIFLSLLETTEHFVLQDRNSSSNFQNWSITGTPVNINAGLSNSYWAVPVAISSSGGSGATNFSNNHSLFLAIVSGVSGPQGPQGVQGSAGSQGSQGTQGTQGFQGAQGSQGIQGTQGNQGYQGAQGSVGGIINQFFIYMCIYTYAYACITNCIIIINNCL